ncbi:hypothetical protein NUU61_009144, partial [Penicillium alfredii]
QTMPPRWNHRKSSTGCTRCKARKVKCDEKRPRCSHCARHNVDCEYATLPTRVYNLDQRDQRAIPQSSRRQLIQNNPKPALRAPEMGAMRILELRLMHHWVTETAGTMSSAQVSSVRDMWGMSVPQMAFEYEPLLHTLLALGAAHRATLLPQEANQLRPVYHGYIDSALQRHRQLTANLDTAASESTCLNAVLISLYTLFLRSEASTGPYEPPLLWMSMQRGIRTVMRTVYHQLIRSNSLLCPLLLAQPTLWDLQRGGHVYTGPFKPFHFLLDYRPGQEEVDNETAETYQQAVAYLENLYISVQLGETGFVVRKMFNGFPAVLPMRFIELISHRRPRALVILAHLFACAKSSEDIWWLRGIPEREINGINSIIPPEWEWTMTWPLQVISAQDTSSGLPTPAMTPQSIDELS